MVPGLIAFVSVLILLSLYLLFFRSVNSRVEKLFFQKMTGRKVYAIAKDNDYYLLNKVAIRVEGKIIHFDHILFGDKYIYCIVNRYYPVAVHGNPEDPSWFCYKRNGKFKIMKNPLRINRERVNYFASAIASSKDIFVGIVLVNNQCLIDPSDSGSENDLLLNLKDLRAKIKRYERNSLVNPIEPASLKALVYDVYRKCVEE